MNDVVPIASVSAPIMVRLPLQLPEPILPLLPPLSAPSEGWPLLFVLSVLVDVLLPLQVPLSGSSRQVPLALPLAEKVPLKVELPAVPAAKLAVPLLEMLP